MTPDVTTETLGQFLQANLDCYRTLEPAIARVLGEEQLLNRWQYQQVGEALDIDLRRLKPRNLRSISVEHQHRHERAYYVGGLYVLVGAQFGTRVIARHMREQALAFAERSAYLNLQGRGWTGFNSGLQQEEISSDFVELAKQGAEEYFSAFLKRWRAS